MHDSQSNKYSQGTFFKNKTKLILTLSERVIYMHISEA